MWEYIILDNTSWNGVSADYTETEEINITITVPRYVTMVEVERYEWFVGSYEVSHPAQHIRNMDGSPNEVIHGSPQATLTLIGRG